MQIAERMQNKDTSGKTLVTLSHDILLHSILPHLTLPDLWSLIEALPQLEPVVDAYKPWGWHYARTKDVPERFMSFREFFPKFQGLYIWGFVQKDTSMAKWIASRPNSELEEDRGPIVFSIRQRQGIFRNEYGFDLLKPLRIDYDIDFYCAQIALGAYLISNGYLFVRVPGGGIEPLPRLTDCRQGSLVQSQFGVQVEQMDGTQHMILPVSDTQDKRINVFKFPFPNRAHCCCYSSNGLWSAIDGMGIIEFPTDYNGGDNYKVVFTDIPENCRWMYSFYRRVVHDSGVNSETEIVPEYRNCAIYIGESGQLYFIGPTRYWDYKERRVLHTADWDEARAKNPAMHNWDEDLICRKFESRLDEQLREELGDIQAPQMSQFCVWGYRYGIGVDERDASILYFDVNDMEANGPFVATDNVGGIGIYGVGFDGYVYRLDFLTGEWSRVPGIKGAKKIFSTLIRCKDRLVELSAVMILTNSGELYQLGYIQGATILHQGLTREVAAPSGRLDPTRLGHYITAPGVNPRRRVFMNPFSDVPRKINLPGFVEDMGYVYSESLLYVALVKEWQV